MQSETPKREGVRCVSVYLIPQTLGSNLFYDPLRVVISLICNYPYALITTHRPFVFGVKKTRNPLKETSLMLSLDSFDLYTKHLKN